MSSKLPGLLAHFPLVQASEVLTYAKKPAAAGGIPNVQVSVAHPSLDVASPRPFDWNLVRHEGAASAHLVPPKMPESPLPPARAKLASEMTHPLQDNGPRLLRPRLEGVSQSIQDTVTSAAKMWGVSMYEIALPKPVRDSLQATYAQPAPTTALTTGPSASPSKTTAEQTIGKALTSVHAESTEIQAGFNHLLNDPQKALTDYFVGLVEPFAHPALTSEQAYQQGYASFQIGALATAPTYTLYKVGSSVNKLASKARHLGALSQPVQYSIPNSVHASQPGRTVHVYPPGTASPELRQQAAQRIIDGNPKTYKDADAAKLSDQINSGNLILVKDPTDPTKKPAVAVLYPNNLGGDSHTNATPPRILSNPFDPGDFSLNHVVTSPDLPGSGGDATRAAFTLANHNGARGVVFDNTGYTGEKMLTADHRSLIVPHENFYISTSGNIRQPHSTQPRQTGVYLPYDTIDKLKAMGMPEIEAYLTARAQALVTQKTPDAAGAKKYLDLIPRIQEVLKSPDPAFALSQWSIKDQAKLPRGPAVEYRLDLTSPASPISFVNAKFAQLYPFNKKTKTPPSNLLSDNPNIYAPGWYDHYIGPQIENMTSAASNIAKGAATVGAPWLTHEALSGNAEITFNDDRMIRYFNGPPGSNIATLKLGPNISGSVWFAKFHHRGFADYATLLPGHQPTDPSDTLLWGGIGKNPSRPTGPSGIFVNNGSRYTVEAGWGLHFGTNNYSLNASDAYRMGAMVGVGRAFLTPSTNIFGMIQCVLMPNFSFAHGVQLRQLSIGEISIAIRISEFLMGPSVNLTSLNKFPTLSQGWSPRGSYNVIVMRNPAYTPEPTKEANASPVPPTVTE